MKTLQQTLRGCNIGGHRRCLLRLAALAAAGALLCPTPWRMKASAPTEYEIKAAYLYNFCRYVQWPAKASVTDGFSICVLGEDPFGRVLDATIKGETIDGMKAVARRISVPQEARDCRLLFISSSEDKQLNGVLSALDDSSVLTVSDMPHFTQRGGMICLINQNRKIHFEINLAAAKRVGLTLSSQLLKVAVSVSGGF